MKSMLMIFFVIAGIILLVGLNSFLASYIYKRDINSKARIVYGLLLVIINIILFIWLDGLVGKIMFLLPFILLGPSYFVYKWDKGKK